LEFYVTKASTKRKRPRGTEFLDTEPADVPIEELRTWILHALSGCANRSLRDDHRLGKELIQRIDRIRTDPKYGEKGVASLRSRLGHSKTKVLALMKFATSYNDEELDELLEKPTLEGVPFLWTFKHVRCLCAVDDKNRRRELEYEAAEHQWTTRDLEAEVGRQRPTSGRKRPGPTLRAPGTFRGCLSDLLERTRLWDEAHECVWFPDGDKNLINQIREHKDALDPSEADMIVTIHERILEMAQRAAQVVEPFGEIRRMIRPGDGAAAPDSTRPATWWAAGQPRRLKSERRRKKTTA
jgi:hypothetical protein